MKKRPRRLLETPVLLLLCFVGLCSCNRPLPSPPSPGEINVVLIVLDATAARYLGCYGNELETTPNIDRLARDATLFERAYSQAAWTLPSVASYMTGQYPPSRGEIGKAFLERPIASLLLEAGLETAGFSENPYVTRQFGIAKGFQVFRDYFPYSSLAEKPLTFDRMDSSRTVADVVAWLDEHHQQRFFLYVHLLPPHSPYDPPPPFSGKFDIGYEGSVDGGTDTLTKIDRGEIRVNGRDLEHLRALYQENLSYADHQVGKVFQALSAQQLLDRTLLIVTSDHGEAFGEHGRMLHNHTVYEEMIQVPLIIRFPPGLGRPPKRWSGVVELTDLLPTICDVLAIPRPGKIHGASLLRLASSGQVADRVARSWTSLMPRLFGGLIAGHHKLILDMNSDRVELYDLRDDPGERKDISADRPTLAAQLQRLLPATDADTVEVVETELGDATLEQLRSLGYLQ